MFYLITFQCVAESKRLEASVQAICHFTFNLKPFCICYICEYVLNVTKLEEKHKELGMFLLVFSDLAPSLRVPCVL